MPPRPSRNLDQSLLAAGRALLPETGSAKLTIRQVCEAAGVNTGMFHYHFRTREAFLRSVMQSAYEEMFARFTLEAAQGEGPVEQLRAALRLLGRFLRDNRAFMARVLAEALSGEAVAREFLRDNVPRHATVLFGLVARAQREGRLRPMAPQQAVGVFAGAIAMPVFAAGAILDFGAPPGSDGAALAQSLLGDRAIDERIEVALAGLVPSSSRPAPARKKKGRP